MNHSKQRDVIMEYLKSTVSHPTADEVYKNVKEKRKLTDIGRYSIGLNSASSSFCNYLFLTSKEKGGEQNSLCMDFQQLRDTDQWLVSEVKNRIDFKIDSQSGTIVVWENLKFEKNVEANKTILNDDIALSDYASRVELHLSKVFFRYIKYYGVKITINGNPVEGWDPFFTDNDNTSVVIKEKIRINGSIIRLEGYVLPVAEHLNQHEKVYEYGFNRNLTDYLDSII